MIENTNLLNTIGIKTIWTLSNNLKGSVDKALGTLDLNNLESTVSICRKCKLCHTRTQTVFGTGVNNPLWMVIGEAPGEAEDFHGQVFVGAAGKLLDQMLQAIDLSRAENVYIANTLKCRPPKNRDPLPDEIASCAPYLKRQIYLLKPKYILLVGRFAAQTLLSTTDSMTKLRGRVHDYFNVPVVVTYHPSYLLRFPREKSKSWADLCLAKKISTKINI